MPVHRMTKCSKILTAGAFHFALLVTATEALAQSPTPAARVSIETTSIAAGFGFSWGHGILRLKGETFHFSLDGMTLMDFGISKASAAGEVYNLIDLDEFDGTYIATEASFALGGGMGGLSLRNQHGVVMHLSSVSQGARLQLGVSGMTIKLWRPNKS
jgi:hypothetical protein